MFFRAADHYLSNAKNTAGGNSQFFWSISSRNHIKNTHLYSTLFIDEIRLETLFDKVNSRNQVGFTFGASVTDFPLDNLTLTAEYTRINPFVYTHFLPAQTYQNASYNLGHWMGNNGDLLYGALNYQIHSGSAGYFVGSIYQERRKGRN